MIFQSLYFPRRRLLAVALASILSPAAAFADTPADAPTNLDNVVVTGVRHAQTVNDTLASVTVIDRTQIEQSPATDVVSLLAQQAGVDVSRTGGAGQSNSVFLRGANSNQTLILIDGIRVAAASNSIFDFANLPLDQVERIEIVRGPRAAYWGSDAIGGVIQIFTRKPKQFEASAEIGSYGERGGEVSFATPPDDESHLGVTFGEDRQRGFSATDAQNSFGNPDDDGYRNRNASVRGSVPLGTQTLAISAIHTDGDAMFDGGPPPPGPDPSRSFARNTSGGATLSGPLTAHWSQSLTLGGAQNEIETPIYASQTSSRRTTLDWVNTLDSIAGGTLTFGGNWQHESGTSLSPTHADGIDYSQSTTNTAGFAGYDGRFGSQQVELAIRHDNNSQFGGATTGSAAWGWQIDPAWRLRASWGQGFRAPSFDELYSPGFFGEFAGFSGLQPERSQSVEGGLEFKPSAENLFTLSAWRTRVRELIEFGGPNDPTFQATNVDRADLDGAELSYRYTNGPWSAGSSITVQDPRDADTGGLLLRRPRRKIAADVHYDFGNGWDVSADGLAASVRQDFDPQHPLRGYGLLNLAAGWNFHPGWRAQLRLNNLFGERYELADGYNTPGRNALLTFIWQPTR